MPESAERFSASCHGDRLVRREASPQVAVYVHIPFCQARCEYCDFTTYVGLDHLMPAYVKAICQEIEVVGRHMGRLSVPTIYFGGGTPSRLPLDLLADLIEGLRSTFDVSGHPEITLEANPGTLSLAYLKGLKALGVNRLSLGAQSAHDHELRMLGRIHSWRDVVQVVGWVREADFGILNVDLIFGLPGQTGRGKRLSRPSSICSRNISRCTTLASRRRPR
jgi:oxygen-independent coproporphyrinogen-3 oxidase